MADGIIEFLETPSAPFTPKPIRPISDTVVLLHRRDEEPRRLRLDGLFPFMTLLDIKLAIFEALNRSPDAYPECIYLSADGEPVDFTWIVGKKDEVFKIADPFTVSRGPIDTRFVDTAGARRIVKFVQRDRFLIEEMYAALPMRLDVFLYKDVLGTATDTIGEREWNGRLYPFFPYLETGSKGPTQEQIARTERLLTIFQRRSQFADKIGGLIKSLEPLRLTGVRSMRLIWQKPEHIPGIEAIFYEAAVNARRPYMRLLATEGSPISKIHLVENKPDLADPKLLIQWSQDRSPAPNHDVLIAKILIRKGYLNVPPIYGTLRILDDGTADYTLVPPHGLRKLDPIDDLRGSWSVLSEGLQGIPFLKEPTLDRGVFVFGVKLGKDQVQTTALLREKLPIFTGFFQEISPLPGDTALITLRYKAVSNFATEDRVFAYITQVLSRKSLAGDGINSRIVEMVADEFQIDEAEARKRVADKLQNQDNIVVVKPESGEFASQYNPGIDISIFGQHPFYSFHVHRVDSFKNMQRITSLLSLLVSATAETLHVSAKPARDLLKAEKEESKVSAAPGSVIEDSDEFEEIEVAPPAPAPPMAADDDLGYDETFLDDFAEDFDDTQPQARPEMPEEDAPAPPPAAAAAAAPAPPAAAAQAQIQEVTTTKDASIANFFINKLKDADKRLFDYTRTHPSLKKYVQQCQPTDGRQPAVLSQEKYDEMLAEYKDDKPPVVFVLYPLLDGEPDHPEDAEYYSVLRYGTSAERQNYYLCSQYFCTRDEILVREADLAGTKMRRPLKMPDGKLITTKKPGECPFCLGTVITNKKTPRPNDTIIERGIKPQSDNKRHLYIRFLKKTPHPEGFYLPCCFLDETPVHSTDPSFEMYKDLGIPMRLEAEAEAPPPITEGPPPDTGVPQVDYNTVIQTLGKRGKYILGAEKFPLEIGLVTASGRGEPQVGLLPLSLDTYFNQTPTDLVIRSFTQQTIKEGAVGFLRAGVENRVRYKSDSFLAAVAPFFKMNSAADVKARLLSILTPKTFVNLNYGNLALEFYNHSPKLVDRPDDKTLELWAEDELKCGLYTQNKEALHRLYNSWLNFVAWLQDPKSTLKEYRHFALLFAQPGLFEGRARRGTNFIVLDVLQSGKMEVRCPPYGYNDDLMGRNNIGFLFHHWSGVWEPIFYVDNRDPTLRKLDAGTLLFDGAYKGFTAVWPDIVRQRASEFITQCNFSGRSIYTSQSNISPNAMIPLSLMYRTLRRAVPKNKAVVFEGVVRDSYNHVAALLFTTRGMKSGGMVAVPVADDGDLGPLVMGQIYLDWDDPEYKKATVLECLEFYKEYIDMDFSLYPGYTMQFIVVKKPGAKTSDSPRPIEPDDIQHIVGIKLRNGLYVPTAVPNDAEATTIRNSSVYVVDIEIEEWRINNDIVYDRSLTNPIDTARIEYDDLQEIYEHLRLSFSNYLAGSAGSDLRKTIQDISMDRTRPMNEKRKDLEILLGPVIMNRMMTDDQRTSETAEPSLLRTDCTLRGEKDCKTAGRCAWAQDSGKCMLHVKKEADLGNGQPISVKLLMLRRLNEEMLRFSERRQQIFNQKVSRIAAFDNPITIDDQMIIPEKSVAWFDLLRLDWAATKDALYMEEMGREAPKLYASTGDPIPAGVIERFGGADSKWQQLRVSRLEWRAIITGIGLAPERYEVDKALTKQQMYQIVRETGRPIIQINLESEDPVVAYKPTYASYSSIIMIVVDGGAGLIVNNPDEPASLLVSTLPDSVVDRIKKGVLVTSK